jgi:hypothetical protein
MMEPTEVRRQRCQEEGSRIRVRRGTAEEVRCWMSDVRWQKCQGIGIEGEGDRGIEWRKGSSRSQKWRWGRVTIDVGTGSGD